MEFVQLQVVSSGSILQSPTSVQAYISAATARGYHALAITDVNVVYNLVPFYDAAKKGGLKPLLGMTLRLGDGTDCILLIHSQAGYAQLMRLSSQVMTNQVAGIDDIGDLNGLVAVTTATGRMMAALTAGDGNTAWNVVSALQSHHPDQVFVGIPASALASDLPAFARVHHLTAVALGDVRYRDPDDALAARVLQAIGAGERVDLQADGGPGAYDLPEMNAAAAPFVAADMASLVATTVALAGECTVDIPVVRTQLPAFPDTDGLPAGEYLARLAWTGLQSRLQVSSRDDIPGDYQERMHHELAVIGSMGFDDYFLIVGDIVQEAHRRGILTGPGRGSAAGSLVAFALGITTVDPLHYHLLFERFLNPNRGQMPDIDLDIQDDRRDEMIDYVRTRYGTDHFAQIMALGTLGPKQAIRDVGRVLGRLQHEVDAIAGAVPSGAETIDAALQGSQQLANMRADSATVATTLNLASRLTGIPRNVTTHAAGVVLSRPPLVETIAVQTLPTGSGEQTQGTKEVVERLGLLKIDLLGLRTLGLLAQILLYVRRQAGDDFDPEQIPLDDPDTLKLFQEGDTLGVFQFESAPMRRVLRQVRPRGFEDVVATTALYRPGPMEYINDFAARMHGEQPVTYVTPLLAPILDATYGIIVYQEQVMQVASAIGGFDMAAADDLRRAMSKKNKAKIDAGRTRFIQGAEAHGLSADDATAVYADIERFAGYGFNRSHAVAYGKLAFWLAYLKVHYPAAFYTAQCNRNLGNTTKLRTLINAARHAGVTVLGPDVNWSGRGFHLNRKGAIRVGLSNVRGLRRDFVAALVDERQAHGQFQSYADLLLRLPAQWLDAKVLAPLIQVGALDRLVTNRAVALAELEGVLTAVDLAAGDADLLKNLWPKPVAVTPSTTAEDDAMAASVLGYYLNGHPTSQYADVVAGTHAVALNQVGIGRNVAVVVLITAVRQIKTKQGLTMAFFDRRGRHRECGRDRLSAHLPGVAATDH
ncbi:DNA polymerase III subunit alpha [Lacticaseibacillus thailandensis]|uniref:DNA polymerase III subunit alpha n=1 Tax=Lacticaseibacillus thailandensis TaxID=381741 RepID=UPI0006D2693C|nr:DNA polymerase III subunit alpha [Lacticaseibacillus thailandensis]